MNNTRTTTLAIVAVLTAVTLVVGLTVAATITPSAFAWKKDRQDKYMKGEQDGYKKDIQANGKDNGSGNGNTNTIQILKQKAKTGPFSILEQNGQNVICTHPSSGPCTNQSNQPLKVTIG